MNFGPHHGSALHTGFAWYTAPPLAPGFHPPDPLSLPCPHSSVAHRCRNMHLLSIDYASLPRLRPRLPQGRSALPWIPWIFGHKDSHLILATHSGILSSGISTALLSTASAFPQCSPTNDLSFLSFGVVFQPRRLVSYYALFECMAASEPTS